MADVINNDNALIVCAELLLENSQGAVVNVKDRPDYVQLVQATVEQDGRIAYGFSSHPYVALIQACVNWNKGNTVSREEMLTQQVNAIKEAIEVKLR